MKLKSLKKFTYRNRMMFPGDYLTTNPRDARILIALGRVDIVNDIVISDNTNILLDNEISRLRMIYQEKYNKRPFMGWDADILIKKINDIDNLDSGTISDG